jgi:tetratricopeptide (TPR) repeat protein
VNPADVWPRKQWALICQHLGDLDLTRDPAEALRFYQESHDHYARLADPASDDHELRLLLAESQVRLGRGHRAVSEIDKARLAYGRAAELQEKMVQAYPAARLRFVAILSKTYAELGELEREQGQLRKAVAIALQRRALWPDNGNELYNVACELARCIPLVDRDKSEQPAGEESERRRYADLAMETLRAALRQGFQDWQRLAEDENLEPLRERLDFQELLKSRSAKRPNP